MKYLVLFREDTTVSTRLPLPALLDAVEATRPYLDELRRKEKIVDWGHFGSRHGLYATFKVKNNAELYELIEQMPIRPFCQVDCDPILEGAEFADVFGKIKKQNIVAWERIQREARNGRDSSEGRESEGRETRKRASGY